MVKAWSSNQQHLKGGHDVHLKTLPHGVSHQIHKNLILVNSFINKTILGLLHDKFHYTQVLLQALRT
jgi:hypothetical protein